MKTKILGLSLLAVGLAGAAYAGAPDGGMDPLGGKTVTKAEFLASHGQMFDKMDANHDGKLDNADRAAHMGQMFDEIDTDHNGAISRDEFVAAHQREPQGGERRERGGRGGHGDGGMGMKMIQMADANKDGTVTRDEFLGMAGQHFDKMDTNHDGKLTKEERKAARAKMKGMRHGGPGGGEGHTGHMPPPPPPAN